MQLTCALIVSDILCKVDSCCYSRFAQGPRATSHAICCKLERLRVGCKLKLRLTPLGVGVVPYAGVGVVPGSGATPTSASPAPDTVPGSGAVSGPEGAAEPSAPFAGVGVVPGSGATPTPASPAPDTVPPSFLLCVFFIQLKSLHLRFLV